MDGRSGPMEPFGVSVDDIVLSPKHGLPFLQPERLFRILSSTDQSATSFDENVTWGIIMNFKK